MGHDSRPSFLLHGGEHGTRPSKVTRSVSRDQGRLNEHWADHFDGLRLTTERSRASATTTLTGTVADQAVLQKVLAHIRRLGLPLLLVERVG